MQLGLTWSTHDCACPLEKLSLKIVYYEQGHDKIVAHSHEYSRPELLGILIYDTVIARPFDDYVDLENCHITQNFYGFEIIFVRGFFSPPGGLG